MGKNHKRPRRRFLANLVEQEALGKKSKELNCGHKVCPINPSPRKSYFSACIEDSNNFAQALDDSKNAMRYLNIGEQITCAVLDQRGIEDYNLPEINPLEHYGIHTTENPGFGYSK